MTESVRCETQGSSARIVLDRPSNRNAITPELIAGITRGLNSAMNDESIRAVVLTHTGTTFCAGADLRGQHDASTGPRGDAGRDAGTDQRTDSLALQEQRGRELSALFRLLLTCPKPVIAAVDGHVRAGGMGLVAACDFAVAGPQATFGLSEVRLGVVPAMIAPLVLARLGDRTAANWVLTGTTVSPAEAARAGFLTRTVDDVDAGVEEILAGLRKGAPKALAAGKALINARVLAEFDRSLEDMVALSARFFTDEDARAGMAAFAAKATPPWVVAE